MKRSSSSNGPVIKSLSLIHRFSPKLQNDDGDDNNDEDGGEGLAAVAVVRVMT